MLLALLLAANGLTLRELQERARKNDPRAMQVAAQLENAQGKRDEAKWAWFPEFSTTAYVGGPTPERRLKKGDLDPNPTDPTELTDGTRGSWLHGELGVTAHADVQAILPIWTFGKLTAGKKAAEHYVKVQDALLERARDQAAYDCARAYWGYQTARNAEDSVAKVRARLKDAQDQAKKLLDDQSDQITKGDAMKLDYLAEEVEARQMEAVKGRDLALTGLRLLVGVAPAEDLPIADQALPPPPDLPNKDEVLRKGLERRPEVRAAADGVQARQALVDLARARLWPDLGLVAGYSWTETTNADNPASPFVNNPYHGSSPYIALGLRGTFDVPQKLARLRQAEADVNEVLALQRGAEQLVRLEVQEAMGNLADARVRADRYAKQTAIGKQLATQAGVAFDSGLGEARELLEDTLLYVRADGERMKALYDAQMAWQALEKAAGGPLQ